MSKQRPQIIFLLIGLLLFVISYLLSTGQQPSEGIKFWSSVIQNISFIILTVVIMNSLWELLGGEPINLTLNELGRTLSEMRGAVLLLQDSKDTGLHRLFSVSGAWGTHREWMQRLKGSRNTVDLMGYTLHVWTRGENFEDEMRAIVKSGVKVRVLIMGETNRSLSAFVNSDQIASISLNSVVEEIKVAKRTFKSIADSLQAANLTGFATHSYSVPVLSSGE